MDDEMGVEWPSEAVMTEEPPSNEEDTSIQAAELNPDEAVESENNKAKADEADADESDNDNGKEAEAEESSSDIDLENGAGSTMIETTAPISWTLPIRAAPILALQGEQVVEFPLSQHVSGYGSTSVVMDEELMRIVEARYDPDGVRRLNVRMVLVKEHISGYSHAHLDLFSKLLPAWWGSLGLGLVLATTLAQDFLAVGGAAFILAGLAGMLMARLDLHRISFSDHGGRHDFYLSGWRQDPYLIHNSTALLGPAVVEFLRTGELNTEHIDAVVATMGNPRQPELALKQPPSQPPTQPVFVALAEPTYVDSQPSSESQTGPPISLLQAESEPPLPHAEPTQPAELAMLPPPPTEPPVTEPTPPPPPPPGPPVPEPMSRLPPPPPTPPIMEPRPILPPPPPPVVTLPPAPLPPAPLPPPPSMPKVDEDALWDDLN
jgi:hypothetical protein